MYDYEFDTYNLKTHPTDIHQNPKFQSDNIDVYLNLQQPSYQIDEQIHQNFDIKNQNITKIKHGLYHPTKYIKSQHNMKIRYLQQSRRDKLNRYLRKKQLRVWKKKISYARRQTIAQQRQRVNGKFTSVKKIQSCQQNLIGNLLDSLLIPVNEGLKLQVTEWEEP